MSLGYNQLQGLNNGNQMLNIPGSLQASILNYPVDQNDDYEVDSDDSDDDRAPNVKKAEKAKWSPEDVRNLNLC